MVKNYPTNTIETLTDLTTRSGGSLFFQSGGTLSNFERWVVAARPPAEYKPFSISIFDTDNKVDVITLYMMVNPRDVTFGQTFSSNNVYTRVGWITSLWGNNQASISANGSTAGFYYVTPQFEGGLTNFDRRNSISFANLMSLVSLFRNNGQYYMDPIESPNLYGDGSRVINVMDTIKVSYDGSDYFGSFTTLSLNDVADAPYRMEYTLEFMVSCFAPDFDKIEGHIKKNGNESVRNPVLAVQGQNIAFNETVLMDNGELKKWFPTTPPVTSFEEGANRGPAEGDTTAIQGSSTVVKERGSPGTTDTDTRRPGTKYLWDKDTTRVNANTYLDEHPEFKAKLQSVANRFGMSLDTLFNQVLFESGGTCDPFIGNSESTALGFIQIVDSSAVMVAKRLLSEGKITEEQFSNIETSTDLCSLPPYDTPEGQADIFEAYYQVTTVRVPEGAAGGPFKGSAARYIASLKNPEDKKAAAYMTIFYPAAVGQPLDTKFADLAAARGKTWDPSKNPGINTVQDYLDYVDRSVTSMKKKKKTIATVSN